MKKITQLFESRTYHPFIIAEIGLNHGGILSNAKEMVLRAFISGAEAVKFQMYNPEHLWAYDTDMGTLQFTRDEWVDLKTYCDTLGIGFICTPFDVESAAFLDYLDLKVFKIGSGDITDVKLLRYIASTGKPIIISTGMSSHEEIQNALDIINGYSLHDQPDIYLMHCVSDYPCPPHAAALGRIDFLRESFGLPVGYSCHVPGIDTTLLAAATYFPCIIEKHVKTDDDCIDSAVSISFIELGRLVDTLAANEVACHFDPHDFHARVSSIKNEAQKVCVASEDIPAGTELDPCHIDLKRSKSINAFTANDYDSLIGRTTTRFICKNESIGEHNV